MPNAWTAHCHGKVKQERPASAATRDATTRCFEVERVQHNSLASDGRNGSQQPTPGCGRKRASDLHVCEGAAIHEVHTREGRVGHRFQVQGKGG